MKHFDNILKDINKKLDLPQPLKSKILLEISADLDDLYHLYLVQGFTAEEAIQKATDKFELSDETIGQLINIHQTPLRKFLYKFSDQAQTFWERLILILLFLLITVASIHAMTTTSFLSSASAYVYPIMLVFVIALLIILYKFYYLYLKKDHDLRKIGLYMNYLPILGGISLFIGIFGYFTELLLAGDYAILLETKLVFIINTFESNSDQLLRAVSNWTISSSAMIMVSLLVTIFTALSWFFLNHKITTIQEAEIRFLFEDK